MAPEEETPIRDIKTIVLRYIQEVIEAFIAIGLYSYITNNFKLEKVFNMAIVVGAITLVLEEYDPKYKSSLKNGMIVAVGGTMIKSV